MGTRPWCLRNRCPKYWLLASFLPVEFSYFPNIAFDIAFKKCGQFHTLSGINAEQTSPLRIYLQKLFQSFGLHAEEPINQNFKNAKGGNWSRDHFKTPKMGHICYTEFPSATAHITEIQQIPAFWKLKVSIAIHYFNAMSSEGERDQLMKQQHWIMYSTLFTSMIIATIFPFRNSDILLPLHSHRFFPNPYPDKKAILSKLSGNNSGSRPYLFLTNAQAAPPALLGATC